jgi:acyl-CoA synthetase (AMP-forming)/AMP-acid ligase II
MHLRTPRCDTLAALYLRSTQWRGAEPLFVDEHERFSGLEALDRSLRLARGFAAFGAGPGEVVAFLCKPSARHALAWFAAPLSGRIAANLHVRETPQRLGETLAWLGARVLVHDGDLAGLAAEAVAASGIGCARVSLGADFDALVAGSAPFDVLGALPAPDAPAAIVLSSGSTGRPKGIVHTQATLLEATKGGQHAFGCVSPHDAVLLLMQPSFAAWVIITLPFVGGKGKVCYGAQFTPASFLRTLQRERITMAPLVPTMWRMVFAEHPAAYDLSSVRVSTISGEPPSDADIRALRERIGPGVHSLYLSSEGFTGSAVLAFTEDLVRPGKVASSGRPGVGVDVKILDPEGGFDDELPVGETGEIAISGPSLAAGYWKDPELTRARFRDGWWRSGDLGRVDDDGYVWVLGRIDNVINSGGIKVSGEEIERAVLGHPAVAQCAVIGVPDSRLGQRIEAWVVARGVAPSAEQLDAHCRKAAGLAGFKVPKVWHLVDTLPTGPTGKLYRRGLRGQG